MTLSTISLKPRCSVNRDDRLIPWFCPFRTPGRKICREKPWYWAQILLTQQMQLYFKPDLSMEFRLTFSGDLTCGTLLVVTQTAAQATQGTGNGQLFIFCSGSSRGWVSYWALCNAQMDTAMGGWGVRVWAWWACALPSLCLNNKPS